MVHKEMIAAKSIGVSEFIERLRLLRSENIKPQTFKRLITLFGNDEEAINRLPELASQGGLNRPIGLCDHTYAEHEVEQVIKFGAEMLFWDDHAYPDTLKMIEDYPPIITVHGNINQLKSKQTIGIVGARNASVNGCWLAREMAIKLSEHNIIIASGLAHGIDTCAHEGSLAHGTIGVIANGINVVYPEQNRKLYAKVVESGVIVTEHPFGAEPIARNFLKRNRIISGLSKAIIIVEASQRSGSLITASYALKQNRKVFAIPGSPIDSKYSGCNWLIKTQKASLLTSEKEVLEFLQQSENNALSEQSQLFRMNFERKSDGSELWEFRKILHNALGFSPTSIEDIITNTSIPYHALNILLLELEVAGKIEHLYGNKIIRIA
jgi:DNA processing protein